jgi:iron complex transport system substrate-binding protein
VRQVVLLLLLAGLVAFVSAACGGDGDGDGDKPAPGDTPSISDGFPVTLERSDGRELTLESAPQRIVALSAGHVEILFAIGAGDQIVAVDQNANYPPEAREISSQISGFEPNLEEIVDIDSDLVIVSFDADGIVGALDNLGVPVFFDDINTEITSIEGVFESILELGSATGHSAEAEALVANLQQRVDAVVEVVADVEQGPRIYHELDETFFTVGTDSFVGDLYNKLKAQNIVLPDEGFFPQLTQEAIIDRDPEVILLADSRFGQTPDVVAERAGWDAIDAVASGRVHPVDPDIYSRPGPRIVDALEELAGLLYPDLFPEEGVYRCLMCSGAAL